MNEASPAPKHPRGIYTLFFTEMWERMSYYGMRALLVLFMVDQIRGGMAMDKKQATAIYGLYTGLVYLLPLPGGWIGDRLIGAKAAVWWGGVVIAIGHLVLGIGREDTFYLGLLIVAVGSGLLKSNMSAMVGQLYPEGGARRDRGFSLFYMGINMGALLGMTICPNLGEYAAWRWGFSAAAAGMILGLVQFQLTKQHLAGIGEWHPHPGQNLRRDWLIFWAGLIGVIALTLLCFFGILRIEPVQVADWSSVAIITAAVLFFAWTLGLGGLTKMERNHVVVIIVLFVSAVMFFAGFEQAGSSFSLFAQDYTIRTFQVPGLGTVNLAAGMIQALNALFVVALAPLVSLLWGFMAKHGLEPALPTKLAWALLMLAAGFVVAALAASQALKTGPVWPTWLLTIYFLHTVGELFLSPVGLSAITKLSPARLSGQMMGIWFLGSALGNVLAGRLAGEVTGDAAAQMPLRFYQVVGTAGGVGLVLWACSRGIQRLMPGIK